MTLSIALVLALTLTMSAFQEALVIGVLAFSCATLASAVLDADPSLMRREASLHTDFGKTVAHFGATGEVLLTDPEPCEPKSATDTAIKVCEADCMLLQGTREEKCHECRCQGCHMCNTTMASKLCAQHDSSDTNREECYAPSCPGAGGLLQESILSCDFCKCKLCDACTTTTTSTTTTSTTTTTTTGPSTTVTTPSYYDPLGPPQGLGRQCLNVGEREQCPANRCIDCQGMACDNIFVMADGDRIQLCGTASDSHCEVVEEGWPCTSFVQARPRPGA